jgi:long-chain acyl-CoA synthetase
VQPEDLATILYTSGTTGEPKGVMLSQRNLASNATASVATFGPRTEDLRLSWLPLSHIFARTCDLYTWLVTGSQLALAETPESVIPICFQLHPTLISGVPYFYEKVQRRFCEMGLAEKPGELMNWFGGRMRLCVSGGAALPRHVARFYDSHGVRLLQGYGLTETSPVIATESLEHRKFGTVGRPVSGVEVRIADDGEILTRGPHVMLGYWNNPQSTSTTIVDGWLHTGDLGQLDGEGFLQITGRKKELIVTAGGKNIAPAYLEGLLIEDPWIQQAVVIGDGRNFLTALIVPDCEAVRSELGLKNAPDHDLWNNPDVRQQFRARIDRRLAIVSRYEQIGAFALLDRPFSVEHGELTPTLKLRRAQVHANFSPLIESLYSVGDSAPC